MKRADIVAAIKNKGFSLEGLSKKHGLSKAAVSHALCKAWPHVEQIIADTIGKKASQIWPSRYDRAGLPIKGGSKSLSKRRRSGDTLLYKRSGGRTRRPRTGAAA